MMAVAPKSIRDTQIEPAIQASHLEIEFNCDRVDFVYFCILFQPVGFVGLGLSIVLESWVCSG